MPISALWASFDVAQSVSCAFVLSLDASYSLKTPTYNALRLLKETRNFGHADSLNAVELFFRRSSETLTDLYRTLLIVPTLNKEHFFKKKSCSSITQISRVGKSEIALFPEKGEMHHFHYSL